jgi:hypothetical protein
MISVIFIRPPLRQECKLAAAALLTLAGLLTMLTPEFPGA